MVFVGSQTMLRLAKLGGSNTSTWVVVLWAQRLSGSKLSVTGPFRPAGSNWSPLTPGPAQEPSGKAGSSRVLRSRGAALWQRAAESSWGVGAGSTSTLVWAGSTQASSGVKVRVRVPLWPVGSRVSLLTPGPLQEPLGKLGSSSCSRGKGASFWQRVAPLSCGVCSCRMVTVVVALCRQESLGVKVRVRVPLWPAGSRVSLLTPGPLQVPSGKAGSARVISGRGGAPLQRVSVPSTGVVSGKTVTRVVSTSRQASAGVKTTSTGPLRPVGSRVSLFTWGPLQEPSGWLGSASRARGKSPPSSQMAALSSWGVPRGVTVTRVLSVATQAVLGVKVRTMSPLRPAGSRVSLFTWGPLQEPSG